MKIQGDYSSQIISNVVFAYLEKPFGFTKNSDISYGYGLFWIEKTVKVNSSFEYYSLNSFPKSRSIGYSGSSNFDTVAKLHRNLGNFRILSESRAIAP
jgi:hypothetical protein